MTIHRFFLPMLMVASAIANEPDTTVGLERAELGKLLQACAVTTKAPLPAGESPMMPAAPYVGNGEVGAVVTGEAMNGLSLFVSQCEFRSYALGGVDIRPDAPADVAKFDAELTQDIGLGEVRGKMSVGDVPFETTVFTAENQPLVFCEVRNPGDKPITVRVKTWARPPVGKGPPPTDMKHPFHIMGNSYPSALSDTTEGVVFAKAGAPGANRWEWVAAEGGGRLRNVGTGRFLALSPAGKVETRGEPGADTLFQATRLSWPYFTGFRCGDFALTADRDRPVAVPWSPKSPGLRVEGAAHIFTEGYAGRMGDIVWAGREEVTRNPIQRGVVASRILGGTPDPKSASVPGESVVVIAPKSTATVVVAVTGVCDWERNSPPDLASLRVKAQLLLDFTTHEKAAELSAERFAAWDAFWNKSYVDTGDVLMNRAWFGGLHLLRSASRAGHTSPALYGLWHTADHNACFNQEFNNYNYMSQMYGACTANRPELATAQLDDILREIPNAQKRAAAAGYRGASWLRTVGVHPASDKVLGAYPQPNVAPTKNRKKLENDQLDAGAFLAQNFIDAYEKTLDPAFQKKAYPMLRVCADFYADYLMLNEEKNRYELQESGAREGTGEDLNAGFSLALIKRVLARAADWSEALGVDADLRPKWRDIVARMSPFPTAEVDGKTIFKEAENNERITLGGPGGNTCLMQVVFPSDDIGLDSDPKLLEIARNTLAWSNSDPKKTSWMQADNNPAYIHAQAASVGWDGAEIHMWLRRYLEKKQNPNLVHNLWGVESAGMIEGIHRMMLQGQTGVIRFFPAWPKDKDARFVRLRAKGAFLVSAELKGGAIGGVKILSEKGTDLTVQNPWPGKSVVIQRKDKAAENVSGERFTLKTTAGESLTLEPR